MVIVGGDAGIGKTALARALADGGGTPERVLWGACDPLSTPRPLGPFVDLAVACGGALQAVVARPCTPHEVFSALREELSGEPAVVIVEDAHWADQATLDVLRLLGRRIRSLPVLAVVTYREEANAGVDALRVALGDLSSTAGVSRLTLAPLSREAVGTLAAGSRIDADELYRRTSGNPFYVTEVIEAGDTAVPATVRDAVLARVAHLGTGSHEAFEVVASCHRQPSPGCSRRSAATAREPVAAGLSAGMLVASGHAIAFRHEIAREAVERWIAPQRRQGLHRSILAALEAAPGQDPARLAHHAEHAGDDDAVVRYAQAAAELAAAAGAHLQAAAQYGQGAARCGQLPAPSGPRSTRCAPRSSMPPTTRSGRSPTSTRPSRSTGGRAMSPARPQRRASSFRGWRAAVRRMRRAPPPWPPSICSQRLPSDRSTPERSPRSRISMCTRTISTPRSRSPGAPSTSPRRSATRTRQSTRRSRPASPRRSAICRAGCGRSRRHSRPRAQTASHPRYRGR